MATRKPSVTTNSTEPQSLTVETVDVVKIGNLTKDPTLRFTASNTALCEVDLAVNPPKDSEEETQFYRLVIFGNLGQNVFDSLKQSTRVIVVGRPDIDEWDTEEGEHRTRKKIIVNAIGADLRYATSEVTKVFRSNQRPPAVVNASDF